MRLCLIFLTLQMTTMQKFDSISHFIQSGDFQYRIFDMGRKVTLIDNKNFEDMENQKQPYPYPFQQKAWLALLLWEELRPEESVIWFLQFPIDELGFVKQSSRDVFLIELLEQTGKNIQAKQKGKQVLDELKESSFAFKPVSFRLAAFHALATCELDQHASQYYQHAHDYLTGNSGFEQWQFLGLQGIADVVARLGQDDNEMLLGKALDKLPDAVLESFSKMLENITISEKLFDVLNARLKCELLKNVPNILLVSALLRAVSGADLLLRHGVYKEVLVSASGAEVEVLVAISGRSWEVLKEISLVELFINKLAEHEQATFNAVLTDLLMIPGMREPVFSVVRRPERSSEVSQRLGGLMKTLGG